MSYEREKAAAWGLLKQTLERYREGALTLTQCARSIYDVYEVVCGAEELDPYFEVFIEYEDEIVSFPLGPERQHWGPDALAKADMQCQEIEKKWNSRLAAAVARLEEYVEKNI